MERLQKALDSLLAQLPNQQDVRNRLQSLVSVHPFNEYEYIISTLLTMDVLDLDGYQKLRGDYIKRNPNLHLFEKGPAAFGKTWAESHIREFVPSAEEPSKTLDPDFSKEYDLFCDGARIEVKASRAVDKDSAAPLNLKALASDSTKGFLMNFQQLKPKQCDVFVWVAVWRDIVRYWVLSATEVKSHRRFSDRQHRGNEGEGQLHVKNNNIHEFEKYEVESSKIEQAIRAAYERELKAKGKSGQ